MQVNQEDIIPIAVIGTIVLGLSWSIIFNKNITQLGYIILCRLGIWSSDSQGMRTYLSMILPIIYVILFSILFYVIYYLLNLIK